MPILQVYVDDDTMRRLKTFAADSQRTVEDLAEAAIAESAIEAVPLMNGKPIHNRFIAAWEANAP